MKTCSCCKETKPLDCFHKRGEHRRSHCKDCRRTRESERNRERACRYYYANYDKSREGAKRWAEENPEKMNEYKYAWRRRNQQKARAHWTVSNHLRSGNLKKGLCEECGSDETHAHHDDYDQPLEVRWLCARHHSSLHKEARAS